MAMAAAEQTSTTSLLTTFYVGESLCALEAAGVQEVIRREGVTPVRHAPAAVVGVINLRGRIVTLLDVAIVLGMGTATVTNQSRIFILEDRGEFIGLEVDRVGEVLEMKGDAREPLPANTPAGQARFLNGIYRAGNQVIALLNPERLLSENRA
jgi:purine-binding chemotaxis protein CheW